ncbi:hypothetical protein diail_10813 [Diaporthe ilicicola]|nr:hypothetical protein diail_10813 [Diaporthe ilicicola]
MQNFIFFLIAIIANMAMAVLASPVATRGAAPPPTGGDLTWCTSTTPGFCTVGVHNNFDTNVIDAYIFDNNCNLYTSTDEVLTDSEYTITWKSASGSAEAASIYVHDVTGGSDEFWHNGVHYQDGWTFESPLPVYYEYRFFACSS